MKKILTFASIVCMLLCSCAGPRRAQNLGGDDTIRILAIGNSFSEDAMEQELYGLFAAAGQKVILGNMYIGGCDLKKHCLMAERDSARYEYRKIVDGEKTKTHETRLAQALRDERWDYISVQQGGGFHGMYETMEPYLSQLISYCRETALDSGFKLIYHVPWAAQAGSDSKKFRYYDCDQLKMYNMIVDATQKLVETHDFDIVINSMDAIQNGRNTFIGDNFNRDGWHLSKSHGRYTASCLWYEKISGKSVVGNPYHPDTLSDGEAAACQLAAHYACLHPYTISIIQ